jgi:hypothetical protein
MKGKFKELVSLFEDSILNDDKDSKTPSRDLIVLIPLSLIE